MKIGGVDIGQQTFERSDEIQRDRSRFVDGDGNVYTRSLEAFTTHLISYNFPRLTEAQKDALLSAVNSAFQTSGTVQIDEDRAGGEVYQGTIWDRRVRVRRRLGSYYSASLQVRRVYT